MLYTPHFLTGAAIAHLVPNPIIALPLAFVSHFALDCIPHTDFDLTPGITLKKLLQYPRLRKLVIFGTMGIDAVLLIVSTVWILSLSPAAFYLLAGGCAGILPDVADQSMLFLGRQLLGFQDKIQWRVRMRYGLISYPLVCLAAIIVLLK